MDLLKKALRFALACAAIFAACVLASAVLGLILEGVTWLGAHSGLWGEFADFRDWFNSQSWSITGSEWIKSSGFSPGWVGYLFALILLALFGVFRSRK